MTDSPNPRIISAGEAAVLVAQHNLPEKLSTCRKKSQPAEQHPKHRDFCCSVTIIEYFDDKNVLVAVQEVQRGKYNSDDFTYFWIGDTEHIVRPALISSLQVDAPSPSDSKELR